MYELGVPFASGAVPAGTNLLLSGPPMTGKRDLAFDVLAHGSRDGDGAIVVSTKDSADRVRATFDDHVDGDAPLGVVDCVTRQQGLETDADDELVRYASSPVDLTGIGIEFSELLRHLYQQRGVERNRTLLYSLSTLLMYSNLQTVFRFLHVSTGRVQSVDGLGLFLIDDTAHDDQTMSTLKQLFDGVVQVRERGDDREARLTGLDAVESSWTTY
jgi:KaiC/GvpD/RAD55 family RecA-like ATPase